METIVKLPELYDLLYDNVIEDIPLYIELTKGHSDIIEYGAGTGRITIPLASAGHRIIAVDNEKAMLEKLSNKIKNDKLLSNNIIVVNDDMVSYQNETKVSCIIIPLTTFNYLISDEQQNMCIKNLLNNLIQGGIVIFELLSINTFSDVNKDAEIRFVKRLDIDDNMYYEYWRNTILDTKTNIIKQNRVFKLYNGSNLIDEKQVYWENRFISVSEITELLNKHGLEIQNIYGDCNLNEYNTNSPDIFIKALKR